MVSPDVAIGDRVGFLIRHLGGGLKLVAREMRDGAPNDRLLRLRDALVDVLMERHFGGNVQATRNECSELDRKVYH